MRTLGAVLLPPALDALLRLCEGDEMILIQALIAQLAVETFNETVLDRVAEPAEVEPDALCAGPLIGQLPYRVDR